jgi:outer membrane protein TolC
MQRGTILVVGLAVGSELIAPIARAQAPANPQAQAAPPVAPPSPAPAPAAPASGAGPTFGAEVPAGGANRPLPESGTTTIEGLEPVAGGLTAEGVAKRGLAVSPSVKEQRARLEAANARVAQTTWQFVPRVTLTASYTRTSPLDLSFGGGALVGAANAGAPITVAPCQGGAPGAQCVVDSKGVPIGAQSVAFNFPVNNYFLSGRASIPISDYILRVADAASAASESSDAAKLTVEAEKLKVRTDAYTLYFNWLRAKAQSVIARKAVEQVEARFEDAKAAFQVGTISKAELLRIQAQVENTKLVLTRAESMVSLTTGQLAIFMEDPKPNYTVGEAIPEPSQIPDGPMAVDRLIFEALGRRLEVRAVELNAKALHHGASAQRAGELPRIEAVGDYTYANPNPKWFPPVAAWHSTWSAGVQATWTIGDTFLNAAQANETEANARATEEQRRNLRAAVAQEVLSAYLDLNRARAGLETQRAALEAAREAYRVTTDLFRAGRATGTDVIEAQRVLLDAAVGDVDARIDLTIAAINLNHATGRDISQATAQR